MTTQRGRVAAAAGLPLVAVLTIFLLLFVVVGGGGANPDPADAGCGAGGTGATAGGVTLSAAQMDSAHTIVVTTAGRQLPSRAAVIAVATAFQESRLLNSTVMRDHDSIGLFQQRVSIYGRDVAADPVRSTAAFLDRLIRVPSWQSIPLTAAAQAVQASAHPDLYRRHQRMAEQVVGLLWPAAAAARPSPPSGAAGPPALCPGGGGEGPVAGSAGWVSTTAPGGLVITGTPSGVRAAQFALAQLGKPYLWGAAGPDAYDCSGLTMAAWARQGVPLAHFTGLQVSAGRTSPTNLSQALAGDLVFIPGAFGTPLNPRHVGMVAGHLDTPDGRQLLIVHAPRTGTPVQLIDAARWAGRITDVRHIG